VSVDWETYESGPARADRTVLLLPGGLNTARSYAELMAQPVLADVRLVAATLPRHGGTPPSKLAALQGLLVVAQQGALYQPIPFSARASWPRSQQAAAERPEAGPRAVTSRRSFGRREYDVA
jgi:pimeloyl-ACP methyl ester carboxylesterase